MAFTQALSNALSGLSVAKRGAEVSSSNIANALTEGYGTRELALRARDVNGYGAGVEVAGMTRRVDSFVLAERRIADSDVGYSTSRSEAYSRLEEIFGKPGSEFGLSARVTELEGKLLRASADPSSDPGLKQAMSSLSSLTTYIRTAAAQIQTMREQSEQTISAQVQKLDTALKQVDRINDDIVRIGRMGQPTAGLYDQRQQIIDGIADIVPIRQVPRDGGRVALFSANGETLLDQRPRDISFNTSGTLAPQMTFASGGLNGLMIDGKPAAGSGPIGLLGGGSLAAAFSVRDEISVEAQRGLDNFTNDLMQRLSDSAVDPTIPLAGNGLIAPLAAIGADATGLSNVIDVNPNLDAPTKLRDGVYAVSTGPAGNGTILRGWAAALNNPRAHTAGDSPLSSAEFATKVASSASANRVTSERDVSYASAKQSALKQAQLADGVDTDDEMQKLMQLEQAFAANAKVIQTIDEMMRHILEI